MKNISKLLAVLALSVLTTSSAGPPATGLPAALIIHPHDTFTGFKIQPQAPSATFVMEFGDTLESAVVEVDPAPGDVRDLVVQVQVETSMTIMDDGPHLDLTDWKHWTSGWIELERVGQSGFRMPKLESDPTFVSVFPPYTADELYDAALASGGQRWADLARKWPDPADGRVAVAISTVRIRVVANDAATPETLFTLSVPIPMGC